MGFPQNLDEGRKKNKGVVGQLSIRTLFAGIKGPSTQEHAQNICIFGAQMWSRKLSIRTVYASVVKNS